MPISLTTLTGPIFMPDVSTPNGGRVSFELTSWDREPGEAVFASGPFFADIDENGQFSVELFTTTEGTNTVNYRMYVHWLDSNDVGDYTNHTYNSGGSNSYIKEYIGSFALAGEGPYSISDINIVSELTPNSFDVLLECSAFVDMAKAEVDKVKLEVAKAEVEVAKAEVEADKAITAAQGVQAFIDSYSEVSDFNAAVNNLLDVDTVARSVRDVQTATAAADLDDGTVVTIAGLQYLVDSTATGVLSATYDLGVDGLVPYQAFYLRHFATIPDGGVYPKEALSRAINTCPEGGVIFTESCTVHSPYKGKFVGATWVSDTGHTIMDKAGVTIIGDSRPDFNDDDTELENGFTILGPFCFAADNFTMKNFGIDGGENYCTNENSGNPVELLIAIHRASAGIPGFGNGIDTPRRNVTLHNLALLGYGTDATPTDQSDVHALLLENYYGHDVRGVIQKFTGAGCVNKSSYGHWSDFYCTGSNKYSVLNKHHENRKAIHNTYDNIVMENYGNSDPDPLVNEDYNTGGFLLEATTSDSFGIVATNIVGNGVRNTVQVYTATGAAGTVRDCHISNVTSRKAYGFDVLLGNGNVDNVHVSGVVSRGSRKGCYAAVSTVTNCSISQAHIADSVQYAFGNTGSTGFKMISCGATNAGFGAMYQGAGDTQIVGGFTNDRNTVRLADVGGTIRNMDANPLPKWAGENLIEHGDCESTDVLTNDGGVTTLAVVPGGQVGNALEITRSGAAAGYATKQLLVEIGSFYQCDIWYKNGTGSGRLFLGYSSKIAGDYTDDYDNQGQDFVAISNASWTKQTVRFQATTVNLFITIQVNGLADATFNVDEILIRKILPTFSNNAEAVAAGLLEGETYKTDADPSLLAVVV